MTELEYNDKIKKAHSDFEAEKRRIDGEYAEANNPYKIGDVISDHYKTIRIEKILLHRGFSSLPCCKYYGVVLKKDGTPAKNQTDNIVYQYNIITPNSSTVK